MKTTRLKSHVVRKRLRLGFIVAIDGPAGAGKSTVSRRVAVRLKGMLLDTGATYRAVGYFAIKQKCNHPKGFVNIARQIKFRYDTSGKLLVDGRNLGEKLRTPQVSHMASYVSQFPGVRKEITQKQRALGMSQVKLWPVVVEGRDVGTVVFPNAPYKFFLTATQNIRAQRRYKELLEKGKKDISLKGILLQNRDRDTRDSSRKHAPLKIAKGAIRLDTSRLSIREVARFICANILKNQTP